MRHPEPSDARAARPCLVLGMGLVTALGEGSEAVWGRMMSGELGIRPLRGFCPERYCCSFAAQVPPETEAELRGRLDGPGEASGRAWLFARAAAMEALEQASMRRSQPARAATGLVLSTTKAELAALEPMARREAGPWDPRVNPGVFARDLADWLGLRGPVFAVSNACASGLVALICAARLIRSGDAQRVLVVGVDVLADFLLSGFSALGAVSRGVCRPFDEERDGLNLGEGAGALLLARSVEPCEQPLAMLRGWGLSNDANHITGPSRTGEGLVRALRLALEMAGLKPRELHYINAHGTGTRYNDEMEARALAAVLGEQGPRLSSLKGYLGHTMGAAGVIEAGICVLALLRGVVPASAGFSRPGVGMHLRVASEHLRPPELREALTLKSGFGGINAVLALASPDGH